MVSFQKGLGQQALESMGLLEFLLYCIFNAVLSAFWYALYENGKLWSVHFVDPTSIENLTDFLYISLVHVFAYH